MNFADALEYRDLRNCARLDPNAREALDAYERAQWDHTALDDAKRALADIEAVHAECVTRRAAFMASLSTPAGAPSADSLALAARNRREQGDHDATVSDAVALVSSARERLAQAQTELAAAMESTVREALSAASWSAHPAHAAMFVQLAELEAERHRVAKQIRDASARQQALKAGFNSEARFLPLATMFNDAAVTARAVLDSEGIEPDPLLSDASKIALPAKPTITEFQLREFALQEGSELPSRTAQAFADYDAGRAALAQRAEAHRARLASLELAPAAE